MKMIIILLRYFCRPINKLASATVTRQGQPPPSCPMLCMYLLQWSHLLPKLICRPVVESKQQILPTSLPYLLNWCSLVDTSLAIYTLSTGHCSSGQINHFAPCILDCGSCLLGLLILLSSYCITTHPDIFINDSKNISLHIVFKKSENAAVSALNFLEQRKYLS